MLAGVGAYYHDIGKLERPTYFIDNQGNGPNIHDTLDPRDSAKFIRRHVEFGVQLAQEHHLPHKVVDIIHQHHGTCLVSFFYQKALRMGLDVNEIEFRYTGPKPQTKIAALVMLADGSEASVRANVQSGRILTGQTPSVQIINPASPTNGGVKYTTVTEVVNKIVDDRLKDGQLDECDLTMRDIDQIRRVFVEILTSIYHPRVDYIDHGEKKPNNGEGKVVTSSAIELPNEPRNLPAADGGSPENSTQPALKAADTEKKPDNTAPNNKPRTSGIGGAGQRIEDE
jgi:putative nucleotidyltransferase with HDIG domain